MCRKGSLRDRNFIYHLKILLWRYFFITADLIFATQYSCMPRFHMHCICLEIHHTRIEYKHKPITQPYPDKNIECLLELWKCGNVNRCGVNKKVSTAQNNVHICPCPLVNINEVSCSSITIRALLSFNTNMDRGAMHSNLFLMDM